jgi:aminoglycoside 3-N-acetyltransferase
VASQSPLPAAQQTGPDGQGNSVAGAPASPAASSADAPVLEKSDLIRCFEEIGVRTGGTLLVHSSLSSFGYVHGAEHTVIDALLDVVGPAGLLVMPTHTWDTVSAAQPVFHEQLSPSITGRITETFRRRPTAVRSLHPTHSVAALGSGAREYCIGHELYSTPCSRSSPYGRLVTSNGQVLMLGVGLDCLTLLHGIEEWAEVPWLFNRVETLHVITREQATLTVVSRRHTNDRYYEERDFPSLEPTLRKAGAIAYSTAGNATIRLIDAARTTDTLLPLLRENPDLVLGPRARAQPAALSNPTAS